MDKETADSLLEREGKCENVVNTRKQTTQKREKLCQCMDCGKSFTRKSSLIVHQRIHTGEKLFMCSECGKRFGLKSSMVRHMRIHTPKAQKICPDCGKSFSRYPSLFQHQKVHRREKLYKCLYCEKSFMRTSQLLAHQRIHKRRPLSERADCEENPNNLDRLRTQKSVVYLECGKTFKECQSLMRHEQLPKESTTTVSTDRNDGFACDLSFYLNEDCNASKFSQTVNDVEQIKVGPFCAEKKTLEVEKRFLCIDCGKSFTRKSSLIVHQRIHTGEKLFMCSECGKRFGLKSSMVRHMRTHSSTIHLQQQKVHRREKPYKCPKCEKSFSRASQLIAHERNHKVKVFYSKSKSAGPGFRNSKTGQFKDTNSEESYICLECGKCFRWQSAFIRHQRNHKGNSYLYTTQNGKHCSTSQSVNKDDMEAPKKEQPSVTAKSSSHLDKKSYIVIKYGADTDLKTSKEAKSFLCIDCGKCFTRKSSLIVHQRTHTGEKLFICTDCGKRFSLKSSLVRHMRTHSPKILNICSDCGKCFTRYSSLFQHQKVHMREKSYQCPQCEKSFSQGSQLLFHQRTHKVEKTHLNSEAGDDSDVQEKRNCYVRDNCAEEPHVCLECGKHFTEERLLIRHRSAHIGNSECSSYTDLEQNESSEILRLGPESNCKPLEMNLKILKSQDIICNALSKEIGTEKAVNFECAIDNSICKPRLSSSRRPYHCIQCGKNFTRKSSLIVHQRIHTGEKHFICMDCGKRFGFKSSLVRHMRTHTGQMFNVCSECGIYFSRYCDLLLHLETHMGQLQFTRNSLSKLEAKDQQSQLTVQQPLNANKDDVTVPLMKEQESGVQEKNQRPYGSGEILPNTSVKKFFNPLCKEKLEEGSLNVKQEKSESIFADGEPNKSQKNKDVCTHTCTLYSGNELNISESFIKGCSEKTDQTRNHSEQPILNVLNNYNSGGSFQNGSDKMLRRTRYREERFLCSECGKNFTRKSSLIVHQRIHTGEKLFMCTECGKRFGLKSSMVRHMRIHYGEFFKCMACGKNFRDYSKFLEHQTSHSGELPYTEPQLSVH